MAVAGAARDGMSTPGFGDSLLARRDVRRLLVIAAVSFGCATWALEAILSHLVRGAPDEPLGGVYRLVESTLWIIVAAIAIRVAESWPVEHPARDWRRMLAQFSLALALGPLWGTFAYMIAPYLMPWWYERGMWGVVAKEAKGALLGYLVTAVLIHVVLRARRQRAREVAAHAMERAATDAQLVMRKLELQPALVLRAMDGIARKIPRDPDGANEALVALADGMRRSLALTRVELVPLAEEIAAVRDALMLRELTVGPVVELATEVPDDLGSEMVPALLLPPLADALVDAIGAAQRQRQTIRATHSNGALEIHLIACIPAGPAGVRFEPSVHVSESLAAAGERLARVPEGRGTIAIEESGDELGVCITIPRQLVASVESTIPDITP